MALQREVYNAYKNYIIFDEDITALTLDHVHAVHTLADAIGLPLNGSTSEQVASVLSQLEGLDPLKEPRHHPVNLLHEHHRHTLHDYSRCSNFIANALKTDALCAAWESAGGKYVTDLEGEL